jgi:primosomal protein N' (replication factor Y)
VVGVDRTAEELGRAFPGAGVVVSRADRTLPRVPPSGALVLATPGVEPFAPDGYAAAVLLDGDTLLLRPDLRAGEDALRRWRAAAALVRPAAEGGLVVLSADPSSVAVQAFVRGDPAGHAARELAERAQLQLPPGAAVASVTGAPAAVAGLIARTQLPPGTSVLGPVPLELPPGAAPAPPGAVPRAAGRDPGPARPGEGEEVVRTLLRVRPADRALLASALRAALAVRSARREPGVVRVRMDPRDIG